MDVIPVIDLKRGQVVHARQGQREKYRPIKTSLARSSAPAEVVAGLLRLHPFRRLYIADLDAIVGHGDHAETVTELAAMHPDLEIWVDSGMASAAAARAWLARVPGVLVLGSESQTDTVGLLQVRDDPRIVLSLDFRDNEFLGPAQILRDDGLWPARVIVMTLARVGSGSGPDLDCIAATVRRGRTVYAAGGVRNRADLDALARVGAAGALVATALHSGTVTAEDLNAIARPQRPGDVVGNRVTPTS